MGTSISNKVTIELTNLVPPFIYMYLISSFNMNWGHEFSNYFINK